MFKNYVLIAFRNFWRNKIFSLINVIGLAIGISASLVIYLIVHYDFSFDNFHSNGDRIYRVVSKFEFSGEMFYNSGVTYPLGHVVQKEVTGLEVAAPFSVWDTDVKVSLPAQPGSEPAVLKKQKNIVFADENYFRLFNYTWLTGSLKTSLSQPYQVVLSEANAKLYFPKLTVDKVVGKVIVFNDTVRATITGVVKDFNQNTDFTFKTFVSRATQENTSLKPDSWEEWGGTNSASQLFVKLAPGTSTSKIQKQLGQLYLKYNKPKPEDKSKVPYSLQPLSDLHFNGNYGNFSDNHMAHKPTLYGLLAIAAFLLLLACINFINLTTSQASQRAKEIGVRKTMGSSQGQLVLQFLSETFLLTLIATILSVVITPLLLKVFSDFIPKGLEFEPMKQAGVMLFLLALTFIVSILSGLYPALVLSSYKPVAVLKNQGSINTGKNQKLWLRKTLTVSQFVIAQVFIIATLLVSKQINYTLNKDLGYRKDAIIYFQTNFYDTIESHRTVLRDLIQAIPEVEMVSLSNNPITSNSTWSNTMKYKDGKKEIETNVQLKMGDTNYIKLYGLKLLAGRNLGPSDTIKEFIINENYMHALGFQQPQQVVGKYLEYDNKRTMITGVVADFHQQSLHTPIKPIAIAAWAKNERTLNIALRSQSPGANTWKTAIGKIDKAFKSVYPNDDFEYDFEDDTIKKYYEDEQHISKLLVWASGLAITISCLGLLGLVMYITNQRTKEIGIRKVVGASVGQIVSLLSVDFLKLVVFAFVIAVPIAWYGSHKWLENFAYKTEISWWIFFGGGIIMLLLTLIVLSIRTIKAASANPVKSLRTE